MCTESEVKRVFKLYSWHKCKFEKARKYAVSGKLDVLYLLQFSASFLAIVLLRTSRGSRFLTKNGESI